MKVLNFAFTILTGELTVYTGTLDMRTAESSSTMIVNDTSSEAKRKKKRKKNVNSKAKASTGETLESEWLQCMSHLTLY